MPHRSVLLAEAVAALAPQPGGTYVDATFGAGGHARALLAAGGRVVAFDRDPTVVVPPDLAGRIELVRRDFGELAAGLDELGVERVDGVLFDVGVSSMQLDCAERGFSFARDGELDMRMDPSSGRSVAEYLAQVDERELADAIFEFGEERAARRIARAIVVARDAGRPPERTLELARLVSGAVHVPGRRERTHPATRTFQALRILVNDELGALRRGLDAAIERVAPGGRIAVIAFHSLEDRIVKHGFREDARVRVVTKKPLLPGDEELGANPRARSAKLRIAERLP